MAVLTLVEDNEGNLALHSDDKNAPFSIFHLNGKGLGYGNNKSWTKIDAVEGVEYDANDVLNDFWEAQQAILKSAIKAGVFSFEQWTIKTRVFILVV